jgi:hypothetical protein
MGMAAKYGNLAFIQWLFCKELCKVTYQIADSVNSFEGLVEYEDYPFIGATAFETIMHNAICYNHANIVCWAHSVRRLCGMSNYDCIMLESWLNTANESYHTEIVDILFRMDFEGFITEEVLITLFRQDNVKMFKYVMENYGQYIMNRTDFSDYPCHSAEMRKYVNNTDFSKYW